MHRQEVTCQAVLVQLVLHLCTVLKTWLLSLPQSLPFYTFCPPNHECYSGRVAHAILNRVYTITGLKICIVLSLCISLHSN